MNFIKTIFGSFYSKSLYQDVAKKWKGFGFTYLLLLITLLSIPFLFYLYFGFHSFLETDIKAYLDVIIEQLPEIKISQGELSINKPVPYFIKDPDGNKVAVIDTSGKFNSLEDVEQIPVLVTKNKVLVKKSELETRMYSLAEFDELFVDKTIASDVITTIIEWAPIVIYPFVVIFVILFAFVFRIFQVLIYAVIGIIFANILKVKLGYQVLLRLAVVSITPVIVLGTLFDFLEISFPFRGLIFFIIAMGYLFYAVRANTSTGGKSI